MWKTLGTESGPAARILPIMAFGKLIVWGGGHLFNCLSLSFLKNEDFSKVLVISRSKSSPKWNEVLCDGATILVTRPFSTWLEERMGDGWPQVRQCLAKANRIVMISSTGVFSEVGGKEVTEESPLIADHPYVFAEKDISQLAPTCVLRCAGLYDESKGPHRYYLKNKRMPGGGEAFVNLLHYDDLSKLVAALLTRKTVLTGIFNVSDNHPTRRGEILSCINNWGGEWASIEAFSDGGEDSQVGATLALGKKVHCKLWDELSIEPKYKKFTDLKI